MKDSLKAIKLLALSSSENVEKIAYYYAMEGKLAEFTVLLTVAAKKVLVPITLSRQDGDGWDGSVTLPQCLENTMGSVFRKYRMGLFAEPEFHRKKLLLRAIAILLQVFERAGNAIEECIQLERHSKTNGEKYVALRLVEAGFRLNEGDFNFSIDDRMNSSGHSPLLPEWNFLSREQSMEEVTDCDQIDKSICHAIAFDDEETLFSLIKFFRGQAMPLRNAYS